MTSVERGGRGLIVAAFAIWLVQPVGNMALVALAYLLMVGGATLLFLVRGAWLGTGVVVATLATSIVSSGAVLVGLARSHPGALYESVFFIAIPLVWVGCVAVFDRRTLRCIVDSVPILATLIAAVGIAYWLYAKGVNAMVWATWIPLGQGAGAETYGSQMRYYPISTLVFVLPFLFWSVVERGSYVSRISRLLAPVALISCFVLAFLAGRRAVFLSTAVAVILGGAIIFLRPGLDRLIRRRLGFAFFGGLVAAGVIGRVTNFNVGALVSSIVGEASSEEDVRSASMSALLASWARSPWLGNGLGGEVIGSVRNAERPWEFEVQYHLGLNAFGVLGALVFACAIAYVVGRLAWHVRSESSPLALPVFAGVVAALVANATNPYLHTPGHFWMFFLAVAVLNTLLRCESDASAVKWRLPGRMTRSAV